MDKKALSERDICTEFILLAAVRQTGLCEKQGKEGCGCS